MEKLIADGLAADAPGTTPVVSGSSMLPPGMSSATPLMNNGVESPAALRGLGLADGGDRVGSMTGLHRDDSSPPMTGNNNNHDGSGNVISPQENGAASVATHVTTGSKAFEGALDGLDFGLDLFGMDSMPFDAGLMAPQYGAMEMQM